MSFSEEQLVQMVQDFMESGSPETTPGCNSCTPAFSLHQHTFLALEGLLACATDVEMELFEKAARYVLDMGSEGRSSVRKRLTMRLRMDGYNASLCRSSWDSTLECPGGDYEYVDVLVEAKKGGGAPRRIIVDVDFRSQFELARPTATYARLSGTLPPIFVGAEEKLRRIIPLLCAAAQESLRERGLHVPPWRRTAYVQSKWLSHCRKISSIPLHSSTQVDQKRPDGYSSFEGSEHGGAPRRPRGSALSLQFSDLSGCCSTPESWRSSVAYLDDDGITF